MYGMWGSDLQMYDTCGWHIYWHCFEIRVDQQVKTSSLKVEYQGQIPKEPATTADGFRPSKKEKKPTRGNFSRIFLRTKS